MLIGNAQTKNWTSYVGGLYSDGYVSIIAHFKIVGMHLALEKTIQVLPGVGRFTLFFCLKAYAFHVIVLIAIPD